MANAANLVNFGTSSLNVGDWTYSLGPLNAPAYLPLSDASVLYLTSSYVTLAAVIDNPYYSFTTTAQAVGANGGAYYPAVASNGTTTVAVVYGTPGGAASSAASSTDLVNWTMRTMPSAAFWSSVTYGGGTFVAVAQLTAASSSTCTVAASSTNGTTWTSRTLPTGAQWMCVIYANSQFIAVAAAGTAAATSPDGITWTARTLPASGDWSAIAYGASLYVTINSNTGVNYYATSPDGITWTSRTPPYPMGIGGQNIIFANGIFLLTATNGRIYTSSDGLVWVYRSQTVGIYPAGRNGSAYGGGLFVILGGGGFSANTAITSTDGKVWTLRTLPSTQNWVAITYTGSAFFATSQEINGVSMSAVIASTGQFTLPLVPPVTGTQTYVKAT